MYILVQPTTQVFETKWWAGMYGAPTCKPHIGWSNSPTIQCLNKRMTKAVRSKIKKKGVKSTIVYRNAKGKKAFCGSAQLKSTQKPDQTLSLISLHLFAYIFWGLGFDIFSASALHPRTIDPPPTLERLRTYPPKFGQRLASLHGRFCRSRTLWFGTALEQDVAFGMYLFESLTWENLDWWDVKSVFEYLRGAKSLSLGSCRPLFPTEIWISSLVAGANSNCLRSWQCGASQHLT